MRSLKGLKVVFQGILCMVLERKKELEIKPKYFLFGVVNKVYISSLYPLPEKEAFLFDYQGKQYILRFFFENEGTYQYEIEEIGNYEGNTETQRSL